MADEKEHHCRRCGDPINIPEEEWYRHSFNREAPREEIEQKLDEGLEFQDFTTEGAILCPNCQADYLVFLGEKASA